MNRGSNSYDSKDDVVLYESHYGSEHSITPHGLSTLPPFRNSSNCVTND